MAEGWGTKPNVEHRLDKYIFGTRDLTPEEKKIVLYVFASKCRKLESKASVMMYTTDCMKAGDPREDIFYCIDNSNISAFDKLMIKLSYVVYSLSGRK